MFLLSDRFENKKKNMGIPTKIDFLWEEIVFFLRNSGIKWEELRRSTAVVFFFSLSFFRRVCSLCLIILPVKIKHLRRLFLRAFLLWNLPSLNILELRKNTEIKETIFSNLFVLSYYISVLLTKFSMTSLLPSTVTDLDNYKPASNRTVIWMVKGWNVMKLAQG